MNTHRTILEIIRAISVLPDETQKVIALQKSPRAVRNIMHFVYGNHTIALPLGQVDVDPIPPGAWLDGDAGGPGDDDLLEIEAGKFVRLFTREGHATLTDERRRELWIQILERLPALERAFLETVRIERVVPGIPRRAAVRAFPEIEREVVPSAPIVTERYIQHFSNWKDDVVPSAPPAPPPDSDYLVDRPQPGPLPPPLLFDTHVPTYLGPPAHASEFMDAVDRQEHARASASQETPRENDGLYSRLMARMGWDRL
jgi:hypothetical protein